MIVYAVCVRLCVSVCLQLYISLVTSGWAYLTVCWIGCWLLALFDNAQRAPILVDTAGNAYYADPPHKGGPLDAPQPADAYATVAPGGAAGAGLWGPAAAAAGSAAHASYTPQPYYQGGSYNANTGGGGVDGVVYHSSSAPTATGTLPGAGLPQLPDTLPNYYPPAATTNGNGSVYYPPVVQK